VARILLEVEAAFKHAESKEERKKLSKVNAKALNIVKQKTSKLSATYKAEITALQEVPFAASLLRLRVFIDQPNLCVQLAGCCQEGRCC